LTDIYAELYLWNKNIDSLIRVLQRMEGLRALPGQTLRDYEVRLEEIRSALNVGSLEGMLMREQVEQWRFSCLREGPDD
jgi:hypothetical protein